MCRRVFNGIDHELGFPEHVGIRRINIAVDGILDFGAGITKNKLIGSNFEFNQNPFQDLSKLASKYHNLKFMQIGVAQGLYLTNITIPLLVGRLIFAAQQA